MNVCIKRILLSLLAGVLVFNAACSWGQPASVEAPEIVVTVDDPSENGATEEPAAENGSETEQEPVEEVPADTVVEETQELSSGETEQEAVSEETDTEESNLYGEKCDPVTVHGIYVSGNKAGSSGMASLITLVEETELNAMVIDVKNDNGKITYKMDSPLVNEMGSASNLIGDLPALIEECHSKDIYLIARIVTFCDDYATEKHPEWAVKTKDGSVYQDNRDLGWLNPYQRDCWAYILEIAQQAALAGFDEVQFDYIRLTTDKKMKDLDYGEESETVTSQEIISEFVGYLMEGLEPYGVYVSADVYGTIIGSETDRKNVGQNYVEMSSMLDYISPMVYPSHYAGGNFGLEIPDQHPYECILGAMQLSVSELSVLEGEHVAGVRPWLQDFTATWVKGHIQYGAEEVREQIQAVYDAGYSEWILWNSSNVYSADALEPAETQEDPATESAEDPAAQGESTAETGAE